MAHANSFVAQRGLELTKKHLKAEAWCASSNPGSNRGKTSSCRPHGLHWFLGRILIQFNWLKKLLRARLA